LFFEAGVRLGSYEIVAPLGAGGMGEVYRARDTKLGRDVAIKVVSDGFAQDPERVARFQREAQLLAALNHPHIAAIHGLEEANPSTLSTSSGQAAVQFLVLELVDGETLADRIKAQGSGLKARGLPPARDTAQGLPVAEALAIARQIADALQAAHEKGIIHRDLKPSNIALTADGQVKVLDFGLAKALEADPGGDLFNSPTLTRAATEIGVILGTAAYMAPEQAKGRAADKRSDVWAFGAVLYEMLTGRRAFDGEDLTDTIAAVMRAEPDWSALPSDVPPVIRTLLKRCLEKDRKQRIADISTAHFLLTEPAGLAATGASTIEAPQMPLSRRAVVPATAALIAAVVTGAGVWFATHSTAAPARVLRLQIAPPTAAALATTFNTRHVAITPDGTRLVYTGENSTLFVRTLDQLDASLVTGLGRPANPFVSPDGQWIGFDGDNSRGEFDLKKVTITGGPAIALTRMDAALRGATWGPDGTIVFATSTGATGLQRISDGGGEATVLTRPDRTRGEADHVWPEFLPGGRAVLFTITATTGGLDQAQVAVLDLQTGTQTTLIRGGSDAHYVPSGHLVYGAAGTLRAVGFDLARLAIVGTPVPVVPQVVTTNTGAVDVAVAGDGTLVYVPGIAASAQRTLVWVDRTGKEESIAFALRPRAYNALRFSPDGTRVAMYINDQENDIWLWDLARASLTQLTFDRLTDYFPVWTPDGRRIVFASQREGKGQHLWWQAADGTGVAERLLTAADDVTVTTPTDIAPDGTEVIFYHRTPTGRRDLMRLTLDEIRPSASSGRSEPAETRRVSPLLQTPFDEQSGFVSPNGRWLAYQSNSSGRFEIYVRPFPNAEGGQWRVSEAGGRQPLWARSGDELFFLGADDVLMRVAVDAKGATFIAATPAKLFNVAQYLIGDETQPARMYDISPDGRRFLMIKPTAGSESEPTPTNFVIVQNFGEELKRLAPIK
jgi:Tol biopolymer transport system component